MTITVSNGDVLTAINASQATFTAGTDVGSTVTFTGQTVTVASGGVISGAGNLVLTGGTLTVAAGGAISSLTVGTGETVTMAASVAGVGLASAYGITVSNGGVVSQLTNGKLTNATIDNGGTVVVGTPASVTGTTLLTGGLVVDLGTTGITFTSAQSGGQIEETNYGVSTTVTEPNNVISVAGGATTLKFTVQSATGVSSAAVNDAYTGAGGFIGNVWLLTVLCYHAGTQILTAAGERAVETIERGDTVTVMRDGQFSEEVVRWTGSVRIDPSRHAHPELAAPIRVKAGALAANVPARDLLLSPEHCLILNDRCVPVKLLVNGASVVRECPTEPFTYHHIELEKHGILIAEGAPSESYLDTGNRGNFDNADGPNALHPVFEVNPTADRWKTDACAPLASVPDEVAPIWQSLANRAVELGMTIPMPKLVETPDLHLMVDGKRVQPTSDRNNRYVFMVPAGARSVTLASRFCIPADKMIPGMRDTRRLGVSVEWMAIRTATNEVILPADHPALTVGWNDAETDGATTWRWTNGAATIPWESVEGSAVLTVRSAPVAQYPVYDDKLRLVA